MPRLITITYEPIPTKYHCVKNEQIRSLFWSIFSCIRTEYGDLFRKSPYSALIQKNTDQKKHCIWTLFTQCIKELDSTNFLTFRQELSHTSE